MAPFCSVTRPFRVTVFGTVCSGGGTLTTLNPPVISRSGVEVSHLILATRCGTGHGVGGSVISRLGHSVVRGEGDGHLSFLLLLSRGRR